jgi:hypothetical protein
VAPSGRFLGVEFALTFQGPVPLSGAMGIESRPVQHRLVRGGFRSRPHFDAIDRAGRQAQLASRAAIGQNGMHIFGGAYDGVHGTGCETTRAPDAARFVDPSDARWGLHAMDRIQVQKGSIQKGRQSQNGGIAAGRTLVDLRVAARDGCGIRLASSITAASALSLRQQCIDSRYDIVRGLAAHVI